MKKSVQFHRWLSEICRWGETDSFINYTNSQNSPFKEVIKIYTRTYSYQIVATDTYLGCQTSTRKPRAGESHTRGNDLPDGKFCQETWDKIKNAIIAYELVKVAKQHNLNKLGVIIGSSDHNTTDAKGHTGTAPQVRE